VKTRSFPTARIILVMALWAGCFPLITAGLDLAPHLTFAAMRAGIAGAALVVAGMIGGRPWPSGLTTWLLVGTAGLGATSLGFLGMFHAAEYVTPGLATVIANTQPLLAAALGFVVLGERVSPRGALGLAMGFAGILVIAAGQLAGPRTGDDFVLGIVYIVLAAAGVTVGNVVFRRLAGTVDPVTCMGSQLLLGAIPLAVAAAVTESGQGITWSATFVLSLVGLALPGTAVVFWLWLTVLETVELHRANAFSFLIPVLGLALGMVFFDEALTAMQLVGVAVTVAGICLVNLPRRAGRGRGGKRRGQVLSGSRRLS
jgi:drug/metabolite transporter (DMT)-like permease